MKPTQAHVKRLFNYDYKTGIVTRKLFMRGGGAINSVVGNINTHGYLQVSVNYHTYHLHQIIWLWWFGAWPENEIGHKDRVKTHNWISNLEDIAHSCNMKNVPTREGNKSRVRGVVLHKATQRWRAFVTIHGRYYHLYDGKDIVEAICHRLSAEQCLNWSNCDSSSPAYKYVQKHIIKKGELDGRY